MEEDPMYLIGFYLLRIYRYFLEGKGWIHDSREERVVGEFICVFCKPGGMCCRNLCH
jgi:hypothetical protein